MLFSLKPTAVASGSELIAQTAGADELASPRIFPPLERVKSGRVYPKIMFRLREGVTL